MSKRRSPVDVSFPLGTNLAEDDIHASVVRRHRPQCASRGEPSRPAL